MKRIPLLITGLLALALVAPACDSGGGGGGGTISGLPADQVIADTPEADQLVACEKFNDYAQAQMASIEDDMQHVMCVSMAIMMAAFEGMGEEEPVEPDMEAMKTMCNEMYAPCMAEPMEPDEDGTDDCEVDTTCMATVGEVEACAKDQMASQKAAFSELAQYGCDDLEILMGMMGQDEAPMPASCQALEETCPSFLEDDDEDDEMPPGMPEPVPGDREDPPS